MRTGTTETRKGQVREGLRYVWGTSALRLPLLWMAVIFTFSYNFSVLFPLLATKTFHGGFHGGKVTLAALFVAMGVGSMIAALAMARQRHPNPRRLAVAGAAFGALTVAASLLRAFPLEVALLIAVGLASMVFMITANSTLQLTSRPDMRGRVMALYGIVFLGGTPIGALVAGWMADRFGAPISLGFGGVAALLTGLVGLWMIARMGLETPSTPILGWRRQVVEVPVGSGGNDPELTASEGLTA